MAASGQGIEFIDDRERDLFTIAKLGEDVREFLRTPVGRYIHERAKIMIKQAEADALEVDPDTWRGWFHGRRKLRQIRQRAATAKALISMLAEAIMEGDRAVAELEEYRR